MSNTVSGNKNAGVVSTAYSNWLSNLNWQIDFYRDSSTRSRRDAEFEWEWFERYQKRGIRGAAKLMLTKLFRRMNLQASWDNQEWMNKNSALLWESREILEDELSKLLFDSMLVLKCSDYRQFYFPRIDFEDFVSVISESPFCSKDLPADYLELPLRVFKLEVNRRIGMPPLNVVSTKVQIDLLNSYRQYFVRRNGVDMTPVSGDVVLDCGACIGEISTLMAGLVGVEGEVHLFDPVPLHTRYCQLQASLNPHISHVLHVNALAVGNVTCEATGERTDSSSIAPGGLSIDSFSVTSLDDYVSKKDLRRVDVVKMDIEGAEMDALQGASQVIREFKPRLSISAYHKPEDLWDIPQKLKAQNGDYNLFFGHHSPIQWESVFYAV